jgi:hypothetical protein
MPALPAMVSQGHLPNGKVGRVPQQARTAHSAVRTQLPQPGPRAEQERAPLALEQPEQDGSRRFREADAMVEIEAKDVPVRAREPSQMRPLFRSARAVLLMRSAWKPAG